MKRFLLVALLFFQGTLSFAANVIDDLIADDFAAFSKKIAILQIDIGQEAFLAIYLEKSKEPKLETVNSLIQAGASILALDPDKQLPPLVWAIIRGDNEILEALIKAGADANVEIPANDEMKGFMLPAAGGELRVRPIFYAVLANDDTAVRALVAAGARLDIQASYIPPKGASADDKPEIPSILDMAFKFECWAAARAALDWSLGKATLPIDLKYQDIYYWITCRDIVKVKKFLAIDTEDSLRLFPCAIQAESLEVVELLVKLSLGKEMRFAVGKELVSPLLYAVACEKKTVIATLVKALGIAEYETIQVDGGSFAMGSTDGLVGDKPVHQVSVGSYMMGKFEVSQALWLAVMGDNPSRNKGDLTRPVDGITWYSAVNFCVILSRVFGFESCYTIKENEVICDFTKNGYRLPTEAEWEFAARGGNKGLGTKFSGAADADAAGWSSANSSGASRPVGQKIANELGIFDMSGNVSEWCWDWSAPYSAAAQVDPRGAEKGIAKVTRGGSWNQGSGYMRITYRESLDPNYKSGNIGFRLARNIPKT